MAGILYWFWSHIQLTQKKVQLLENAVFELRGMLANKSPEPPDSTASTPSTPPATVYKDIPDEEEDDWAPASIDQISHVTSMTDSDLSPGGRIDAPQPATEEEVSLEQKMAERSQQESHFRELFVPASPVSSPKKDEEVTTQQQTPQMVAASLESMPVKELRRLAEERGIAGAAEMRKKDILTALRSQIPSVERTVDIAELVKEEEAPVTTNSDIKEIPILE